MRQLLAILIITAVTAATAFAQPLAERVPADAIVYFGWRGTADPGKAYDGSRWQAIAAQSQFNKLIDDTLPAIAKSVAIKHPKAAQGTQTAVTIVQSFVRYPTAVFLAPSVSAKPDKLLVVVLIRVPAGKQRDALNASLKSLIELEKQDRPVITSVGDDVALLWNAAEADAVRLLPSGGESAARPITEDAGFKAATAQSGLVEPTLSGYINAKGIAALIEEAVAEGKKSAAPDPRVAKTIDELGLQSIKTITYSAGFKGREWASDVSIETDGPRKGLLALATQKAFNADLLKRVPASATNVSAVRFDPAVFVAEVRRVATAVDPQWGDMVAKGVDACTIAIGKNFERDVLGPMGDEWIAYNSPDVGGSTLLGTVFISKVDDALKARQGMFALWTFASNTARTFTRDQAFTLGTQSVKVADFEIQYFATPLIAPSWVIKDGYLYAGWNPQTVAAAVQYAGPSIAESPKFAEAMKHIGKSELVGFSYTDTQSLIPEGYTIAMAISRTTLGLGDMFLGPTGEMILPPLPAFTQQAGPAVTAAWSDEKGLHYRAHEPFPAASTLAKLSVLDLYTGNPALTAGILLPSLNRAREAANRVKSASNLRMIGLAAKMYANEDPKFRMPDDFTAMLKKQDITLDVFINPRSDTDRPNVGAMTPDQQGAWATETADYIWGGKGFTDEAAADRPLAWENPLKVDEGINVLFFDGHVDWMRMDEAKALFEQFKIKQEFAE